SLCSQWFAQSQVAEFVAAAVRSHLGMPPREVRRPTAVTSVREPTRGSSAAIVAGSGVGGLGGKATAARSGGGGGQVSNLVTDDDGEGAAAAAAAATAQTAEEPRDRPSKKRRTGAQGKQHLQQSQHAHGAKFGNLSDIFGGSQNAAQQRTQAETRGMRDSDGGGGGAAGGGAGGGGNGGSAAAEMEAAEGWGGATKFS
ncbi:hypothetical protein Vafri_15144, partial [Volvox africanus]